MWVSFTAAGGSSPTRVTYINSREQSHDSTNSCQSNIVMTDRANMSLLVLGYIYMNDMLSTEDLNTGKGVYE